MKRAPIVLSVLILLAQVQLHADPPASNATACDAIKVDARNVVLWVLCHNQADARQDKNEPPYLIEVWLGYRSGRALSSRANFTMVRSQKKISGPSWRSSASRLLTKLSVVGRLTRDTSRVQLVRPMTGRIRSNLKRTPQGQKRALDDARVPHGPSGLSPPTAQHRRCASLRSLSMSRSGNNRTTAARMKFERASDPQCNE